MGSKSSWDNGMQEPWGIGSGQSEGESEQEKKTTVKTKFKDRSKTIALLMYFGNLGFLQDIL